MKIKPLAAALAALGVGVCFGVQAAPDELREKAKVIIQPIEPAKIDHPAKVDLGRQLFLRTTPVDVRHHLLQHLPQPVAGRSG